ncbi:MAG: hypothetical protein CL916_05855 [Deltaproteobacteria bacterium]|nr:hypothetical protein [Deltaproteobacteria bacterium]
MLLFLCGTNSVRSPMAQAIAQHLAPRIWVDSCGIRSSYIHPYTRDVLEEDAIDHRFLRSTDLFGVEMEEATEVIILCLPEEVPRLPKRLKKVYWGIPDPLCAPPEDRYDEFQACRDTLKSRIQAWLKSQKKYPTYD